MNNTAYSTRRAELVSNLRFLLSKHLYLSARDRIRKIADLDFKEKGIPIEDTYKVFNYYKLK